MAMLGLNRFDLRLEYDTAKAWQTFQKIAKYHLAKFKGDFEMLGPDACPAHAPSADAVEAPEMNDPPVVSAAAPGAADARPAAARHPDLQILAVRATQLLSGRQQSGDTYTWQARLGGGTQARVIRLSRSPAKSSANPRTTCRSCGRFRCML